MRALRDEFQGQAEYLHRTPSLPTSMPVHRLPTPPRVVSPAMAPGMPPRIQLVDRPAGDSMALSLIYPGIVEIVVPGKREV
jgi:hypothetical protein